MPKDRFVFLCQHADRFGNTVIRLMIWDMKIHCEHLISSPFLCPITLCACQHKHATQMNQQKQHPASIAFQFKPKKPLGFQVFSGTNIILCSCSCACRSSWGPAKDLCLHLLNFLPEGSWHILLWYSGKIKNKGQNCVTRQSLKSPATFPGRSLQCSC